jgi:hypothetical protein
MRFDTVLNIDSQMIFKGLTDDTVRHLESMRSIEHLWVSIGETGDLITASQYLDLAS